MEFKKVAKMKESFSQIGLGCWGFAGEKVWDGSNDTVSIDIIHTAIDQGINFFDVAPIYGQGHAEKVVGRALRGGKREKILLATKCGLVWDQKGTVTNNLSKVSIMKEIDASLKRLQTDYIDIYQLHWPNLNTPIEETIEAIEVLKKNGKIRYFGVTNFPLAEVKKIVQMIDIDSQQSLYNMMERNTTHYHEITLGYETEKEIIPFCHEHGQAFFPYSPLFQGLLTGTFKDQGNFSKDDVRSANPKLNGEQYKIYYKGVQELQLIADKIGKPLNEIAFNWLRQKQEVTSIISGALTREQLLKNLKSLEWELKQEEIACLDHALRPFENL